MPRVVAVVAALLSAACASAKRNPVLDKYPPGVSGRTTVIYYDVHGRTLAELRADLRRLGPKIDGNSFVGETRSPMRWGWRLESSGGSCSVREVNVSVNAQITLPRWAPPADPAPGLVAEWNRFLSALELHESGHKDISARAGKEIIDQLRNLSAPCAMISQRANDIARRIFESAREEQAMYDATTRHGLTQGTGFGSGLYASSSDSLTLLARPRPGTMRATLPAAIDRVWAVLPAAYAAAKLTVNAVDSSAHVMGDSTTVRGVIGALPASEFLDCGAPPSGRSADSVVVSMFVTSRLEPSGPLGTTATHTVQAIARPAGSPAIACRSRGVIERQLVEFLLTRFVGSAGRQ